MSRDRREVCHGNSPRESRGHPGSWLMVSAVVVAILLGIAQGVPTVIEALGLIFGTR